MSKRRTGSRTCNQDPAPTVRQREVLSRVDATFTLAELQESACHRYAGHTRRMVDSMVARGAVEAVGGGRYRKTECAVPPCVREPRAPAKRKGRKRAKASKRTKASKRAAAPSVPLDRPGIYAVDSKGRVSTAIEGARDFDGSTIAEILAVVDRRGPWTVHVVRPGRGRRRQIESITGDGLLEAARREGKQIERAVLFTHREFELATEAALPPADATEPSRPVQFKDYERVGDRLYVGPQRALALVKTRKGWVVVRRGLHDRLWRIVDGPMKWNKARSAAGVAAAQPLPVPPALGAPRPIPTGDASALGKVGLAARAKAVTLLAVAELFMAVGDALDLSPWARAPFAPTLTAAGWTVWGQKVSLAVLGCMVGQSAEANFEAPKERTDRFDTEWLTHAFRRYRWDLGPLTKGTWVADGEVDGRPRTIQLRITGEGVRWGTLGQEANMGPFTRASDLLDSVVRVLRLHEREQPAELDSEQPVDLLALTDRPEVVRPLLEKASKRARAFLERVVQASPRAAMITALVDLLGVNPKQIGGITAEIYQLAERHGLVPPLVAKMFDGERGWKWAGWQVKAPKPTKPKARAADKPLRPTPKMQREPTNVRIRRRDGGHRWALLHEGRPVSWLTYRKRPAKTEKEAESAARRDLKARKRRGVVNGRSVLAPNVTPWRRDGWSVALLPAETAMPDSVFASYYRSLSGDMDEVRAFIERRKAAGVDLEALGVEIPDGWDTPAAAAIGAPTHVLIGCVKAKKASGRHPAGELYEGALWDLRRAYADARALPWAIISAAHGVIAPDEKIKPYDQKLRDHTPERRRVWQSTAQRQLAALVGRGAMVEVLAGKAYIEALQVPARALGITLVAPAAGKGIGARKKWLADRVAELGGWVPTRDAVQAEIRQHWSREGRPPEYYSPDRRVRFSTFGGRVYRIEALRGSKWVRHGVEHKSYTGAARAALDLYRANRDDAATVDPPSSQKIAPSGRASKPPLRGRLASGAKRDGTATVEPAKGRKGRNRASKGSKSGPSAPPLRGRPASEAAPSRGDANRDDPATVPCLPYGAVDVGDAPAGLEDTARLAWQIRQAAAKLGRPTRGAWVVCGSEVYPIGALPEGIDPAVPAVFVDVGAGGVDQVERDDGFMLAVQTADQALRRHRLRLTEDERGSLLRALRFARGDSTKAYDRHLIKTLAEAGFRRTGQLAGGKEVWTDGTGAMSWAVARGAPNSEVLDAFFEEMARHLTRDMAREVRERAQAVLARAFRMARRTRSVRPKGYDRSAGGPAPKASKAASKPSASPKASRKPGWQKGATSLTIERAEDADAVGLLRPGARVKVARQGEGTLKWWIKLEGGRVRGLVAFDDGESFVDHEKIKAVAPAPAGVAGSDGHPNPGGHGIVVRTTLGANRRRKGKVRYATFSPQGGGASGDAKTMGSAVGRALVDAGLWQTGEPVVIRYEQTSASGEVKAQQWTTNTSAPKNAWGKPIKLGHMPATAATPKTEPKASKPTRPVSAPSQAAASESPTFTITPTTHTKKGHPIWVVQLHGPRLPKDRFAELKALAKRVAVAGGVPSGYYSGYRKRGAIPGFIFASAPEAEAFVDAADAGGGSTAPTSITATLEIPAKAGQLPGWDRRTDPANGRVTYRSPSRQVTVGFGHGDGFDVLRRDGSTWRVDSSHGSWAAAAKAALRVERELPAIDVVLIEQGRWPHKLDRSTPITRVFRGQQWDARREFAKRLGAEVVVVSGLGLLMSSYSVRPGEVRPALNKGFDAETRRQLTRGLPDMLRPYARGGHRLRIHVFCADPLGAELVDAAERAGIEARQPTKGMGVGDERQWLASQHASQPATAKASQPTSRPAPSRPTSRPAPFSPPAELDKPGPRTKANLRAVQIAHALQRAGRTATDAERAEMLRYSGWGGLSIAKVESDWPDGIPLPNKRALVHEYYTPWKVCADITAAVHRLVNPESARVQALEPSAGIGRFVHTARFPGWQWTAAELSPLSALILEQTLPDVDVHVGSFESWVQANGDRRFDVIVSNPPYGPRGETIVEDKDRRFRVKAAYQYFILRSLTLLRPGGVAAFLVPGGFMTGSSTQKIRRRVAESAELLAAFRLPNGTFPGARLSFDVVFLRASAGAVDDPIFTDGQYFNYTPQHILGEIKPSGRWGDPEVIGEYPGLPAFEPRQVSAPGGGGPPASAEVDGAGEGGSFFVPLYELAQAAVRTENYGKKFQPSEAPRYEKTVWWWAVRDVVDNDRSKKDREAMLREALEALRGATNKAVRWEQGGGHSADRMTRDEAIDLLIDLRRGRDTIKEGLQALKAQRGRRSEKDVAHDAEGFAAAAAALVPVYDALQAAHRWSTVVVPMSVLDWDQIAALKAHHTIQWVAGDPRQHHIRLTDKSRRYFAEHPPQPLPGRAVVAPTPTPASPPTLVDERPRGLLGDALRGLDWSTPEEVFEEMRARDISPEHAAEAIAIAYAKKHGGIDVKAFAEDLRVKMAKVIDVEPVAPAEAPAIPDNVTGLFAVQGQDVITIDDARFMGTAYQRKPNVYTVNTDGAAQLLAARGGRWRLVLRLASSGDNWRDAQLRDWPEFPEPLAEAMKTAAALHGAQLGEMVVESAGDGPYEHATPTTLPHPALPSLPVDVPRTTLVHALERAPKFMDEGFAHTAWRHKQRLIAVRRISMVTWNLPDGVVQWYGKDGKPWHDPELQTTGEWKISLQSGVVRLLRQYDEACAGAGGELPTKTLRAAVRAAPTVEWDNLGKTETEKRLLLVVRDGQLFAEDFKKASKQVHLCAFDGPDCAIVYPVKQIRAALAKAPATIRLCVPDHARIDEARLLRGSVLMIDRGDGERHYISAVNMTAALLDELADRPVIAAIPTKPKASATTAATVPKSRPKASPTAATAPKPKASTTVAAAVRSPSKAPAPALPAGATKVSKKAAKVLETITAGMHAETADAIVWRRIGEKGGAIMPLSVDRLRPGRFAVAHYFKQNGDLVPDPDVEFIRVERGVWVPVTYQDQRKYGRYEEDGVITDPRAQRDLATMVSKTWMPNVREQHLVRGELPDHQITRADGTDEWLQTDASRAAQAAEKLPAAYRDLEMEGPRPSRASSGKGPGIAAGLKAVEMERQRVPLTAAIERARFFADPGDPVLAALGIADGLLVASDGKHLVEIGVDDDGPPRAVNAAGTEVDVAYPPADQIVEAADPVATVVGDLGKVDRALRKLTCDPVEIELRAHEVLIGGQRMPGLRIEPGSISGTWCLSLHRIRPALIGAKKGRILLGAPTAPVVVERDDGEHHRIRLADAPCAVCPPPAPTPAADELPREPLPAPARGPTEKDLARLLSERVGAFHAADAQRRALLYPELAAALDVFEATFGRRLATIGRPDVAPPVVRDDADVRALLALHPAGVPVARVADVDGLLQRGWRLDGDRLLPRADYLSGNLWDRLTRLEAVPGRFQRAVELQRREIEDAIGVVDYHQVADRMSLRDGWVPPRAIGAFLGSFRKDKTPIGLERREGLLQIRAPREGERGTTYEQIQAYANTSSIRLIIGYINHDDQVFKPRVSRRMGEDIHAKRRKYAEQYERSFRAFVETRPDLQELIADAYRRANRGFVQRTYSGAPLQLARWGQTITPHPHQNAGARRAVDQRGMVAAYGVGVGKTFTACATVALARQNQGTRRPVILVPNSLVSKWQRDIQKALPDFAVVTIGEKSTKGRDGTLRFGPDTKADREAKWARFTDGLYDLALVTPSAFLRTQITPEEFEALAEGATELQRMVRLAQRNARSRSNPSERQQAVLEQGVRAFLAEMMELPESWARDDVRWSELGVDLLIVDEAQNYKGLHSPELRQGTVPRFMGQTQPSKRAWNLDARARDVRGRGGFVVLLSATPAKNSPLELYNLWSYVNGELWRDHGIHDPESFISRFLQIEPRLVINAQMEAAERPAVTAFKNLDELKAILLRWGEFIQPPDIGLVVPEPTTELVEVDMDAAQEAKYERYVVQIEAALEAMSRGEGNSNAVLGLLARMGLVAVHAELDRGYKYRTAGKAAVQPSSPKFEAIADYVLSNQTCGHIVFVQATAAHRWLKDTLVARGIAKERIGVLNAEVAKSSDARQRVADRFNDGKLDVVIANSIAYEGLDLQVRTCAIHHADLPWEPATLNQRNGRAVRQGNTLQTVAIRYYFSRRSMDGLRFNLIQGKQGWMGALLEGSDAIANPGADLELGPDEILLLISRTPEETQARLDKLRAAAEAKRRLEERERAESMLRTGAGLLDSARVAAMKGDDERRARLEAEGNQLLDAVEQIEPAIWPWRWLLRAARDAGAGEILARVGRPPLFPGCWLRHQGEWLHVGRTHYVKRKQHIRLRAPGRATWNPVNVDELRDFETADVALERPGDVVDDWHADAKRHAELTMKDAHRGWRVTGWAYAAPAWLAEAWTRFGGLVEESIRGLSPQLWKSSWGPDPTFFPFDVAGEVYLQTEGGPPPAGATLLPPTAEGFERWIQLAVPDAFAKLTLRDEATRWWWGRPLPRGLQRKVVKDNPSHPRGTMRSIDLRAVSADSHVVIGLGPDDRVAWTEGVKGAQDAQRAQKQVPADLPVALIVRVDNVAHAPGGRRRPAAPTYVAQSDRLQKHAGVLLVADAGGQLCQVRAARDLGHAYRLAQHVESTYPRVIIGEVRHRYSQSA